LSPEEFEQYRHQAAHELMDLNEQCENAFRLSDWPRWSYDLETASLTFTRDGVPRVIASVQVAGTTSAAGKSWLWGWANPDTPRLAVERMQEVRAIGEREGIAQLTAESLPDDEFLGWEMTAIAARILGAKGAYRCPSGDGFIYLVYTDLAFAPQPEAATVECPVHGRGFPAYLCEHLVTEPAQPWFSDEPTAANRWPDAWCGRCDAVFQEAGEWNERNSAQLRIKLLCHRCYEGKRRYSGAGL
jgi:hypothetical protein